MRGLYLHAGDNKLFAFSSDGGLWVCRFDPAHLANATWIPISDYLDNLEVRAFAVAATDSDIIYLANKTFALYRTRDGGRNWTKLTSFNKSFGRVNKILVRHNAPNWIYVATTTGLYQSWDGGETWNLRRFEGDDVLDIAMDSDDSRIVYVGVRGKGVFKTLNRGTTWENILLWQRAFTTDFSQNPPRITPSGVIKIALGERKADGTDETAETRTVAVKFGKEIKLSNDAGATFHDRSDTCVDADDFCITNNGAGHYLRSEDFIIDEWANAIAIDPFNSNHIFVGQAALFETNDGGRQWEQRNNGHEDIQDIQFHRQVGNLVFLATDGGIERSIGNPASFAGMSANLITAQLMRIGIRGAVAVGNSDHNGIIGTRDLSSGNWERATPPNKKLAPVPPARDGLPVCGYGGNGMESMAVYVDPQRDGRFYIFHTSGLWHLARLFYPYPNSFLDPAPPNNNNGLLAWGDRVCPQWAAGFGNFAPLPNNRIPERPQQGIAVDERSGSQVILACASDSGTNRSPYNNNAPFRLMLTRNGNAEPRERFDQSDAASLNTGPTWEIALEHATDPYVSVAFSPRNTGLAYVISKSGALTRASFTQLRPDRQPLIPLSGGWRRQQADWATREHGDGVLHFAIHPADDRKVYAITANAFARTSDQGLNWKMKPRNIPTENYYLDKVTFPSR